MTKKLNTLLAPRTVAVVGASPRPGVVGGEILRNIVRGGYHGAVYPVNPNHEEINGIRCFASVTDIPVSVDLAIVAVKRDLVLNVVRDCGAAKVPNLVIITAGFKESGAEGAQLEDALHSEAARFNINLVGPNCMGIINSSPEVSLNASFSRWFPNPGPIAFISQSGSLGETFLEFFDRMGLGVSLFINLGNRSGLTENDLLVGLNDDPRITTVFLYLESFADPRGLRQIAGRIGEKKHILVLKAGRTRAGAVAAASHTGALATPDAIVDAFLRQSGIIRVTSIDETLVTLRAFTHPALPHGRRVAILTNAGGAGIIAADACERAGLEVPRFSEKTRAKLAAFLPPEASIGNPVDMIATAGADDYARALAVALTEMDAALVIFRPPIVLPDSVNEVAERVISVAAQTDKAIVACTLSESKFVAPFATRLTAAGIPVYTMPEDGVAALSALYRARKEHTVTEPQPDTFHPDRDSAATIVDQAQQAGVDTLLFTQGAKLLSAYGIPVVPSTYEDEGKVGMFIKKVGFPLAAKLDAPGLLHRFERGAVIVGIPDRTGLARAIAELTEVAERERLTDVRILIQPMLPGRELIFGMKRDPAFGPVLMFGIGGTLVEALHDVSFGIAPISPAQAEEMIHSIRAFPLLESFRGQSAVDIHALATLIYQLSRLSMDFPAIAEIDINPFIIGEEAQGAADILIKLGH